MRKRYTLTMFLFLFILPAVTYSSYDRDSVALKETSFFHNLMFKRSENASYLGEVVYIPKEPVNLLEVKHIVATLSSINPEILKKMSEKQLRIKLFNGKLTEERAFSHLKGIRPRGYSKSGPTWDDVPGAGGSETVYVKIGSSNKGMGHGSINLELHETAHTIDKFVLNRVRDNPEFLKVWREETERLFPNRAYFIMYPEEYFAETFAMFYLSKLTNNQLKEQAPKTYDFLQQALEQPKDLLL